jgi:hypothetical protein
MSVINPTHSVAVEEDLSEDRYERSAITEYRSL